MVMGTAGYLYNAEFVSSGGISTQGNFATGRIQVNASGNIVAAKVMDGGSAYKAIGESLHVVGVATTGSTHVLGIVTVTSIYDSIGDTIELKGIVPDSNNPYNTLYRITGIKQEVLNRYKLQQRLLESRIP